MLKLFKYLHDIKVKILGRAPIFPTEYWIENDFHEFHHEEA